VARPGVQVFRTSTIKREMMIYLYVKTHRKTSLKYLGKTTQDPYVYNGSGKRWLNHLRKHGYEIDTEIIFMSENEDEIKREGIKYSILWDVVSSKKWANLKIEEGDGGFSHINDGSEKHKERCKKAGKIAIKKLNDRYENGELIRQNLFTPETSRIAIMKLETMRKKGLLKNAYKKVSETMKTDVNWMKGKIWCIKIGSTDTKNGKVCDKNNIPDGWMPMRNLKEDKKNKNSPVYGKMWIYNPIEKRNVYIFKDDEIPKGWCKGRKMEYYEK
jgi:hypothetical protein